MLSVQHVLAAVAAFFLAELTVHVNASYRMEVTVLSYINPNNQDFDGGCCDVDIITCEPCETYFLFCLRDIGHSVTDDQCTRGAYTTTHAPIRSMNITFTPGQDIVMNPSVPNPLVFTGNSWPGSFQLLVRVNDEDRASPDDLIDRVIINTSLAAGSSLPAQDYRGFHDVATMEMEVTVRCDPNFFGDDCTRNCEPRDDSLGHFVCDSNGNIVCLPGWMNTATNCTTPTPTPSENATPTPSMVATVTPAQSATPTQPGAALSTTEIITIVVVVVVVIILSIIITATIIVITFVVKRKKKDLKTNTNDAYEVIRYHPKPAAPSNEGFYDNDGLGPPLGPTTTPE